MERNIQTQVLDTLHLLLRIIMGICIVYAGISTALFLTLGILWSQAWASKYGSPFNDVITWISLIVIAGSIPSTIAGSILIIKNRVAQRNPVETVCAIANILLIFLFTKLLFSVDPLSHDNFSNTIILIITALMYTASAVAIIMLAKRKPKISSGAHLIE